MFEKIYAHSISGEPPKKWQSLENHLEQVAQIAGNFAQPFDGSIWAQLLGLSHDIGKGSLQRPTCGMKMDVQKFL